MAQNLSTSALSQYSTSALPHFSLQLTSTSSISLPWLCPAAIYDSMVIILDALPYQYILRLGAVERVVVREVLPPGFPRPWSRIKKSTALTLYIEHPMTQATRPAALKHRRLLISVALDRIITAFPQRYTACNGLDRMPGCDDHVHAVLLMACLSRIGPVSIEISVLPCRAVPAF